MNRLQHETSPYLRQHQDNPVDWYAWGEAAFAESKANDKPILLSVGYSACHWCHVMAHESFEDPITAQMMNELFVNVKVDREERPDVDGIYMQAVMAFTGGHGGWPMTVFLTPEGKPFYGGTYYPNQPMRGMPSFKQVMQGVIEAYRNRREEVERAGSELSEQLSMDRLNIGGDDSHLTLGLLAEGLDGLRRAADRRFGGFGGAPKFPQPMSIEFLLRSYQHTQDADALAIVKLSLDQMARGGIYDQIGGGFARYATDSIWLVPHFEKMLYDNAQLSRAYLHGWQVTGEPMYRQIAEETYDYILREMTSPQGGFYSATDADSEGEEGKFFVWTIAEVQATLSAEDAKIAIEFYGMSPKGNFEGHNILYRPNTDDVIADRVGLTVEALQARIQAIKAALYSTRQKRVAPGLDDKILASWNGLMLASLAEAARVLGRADYTATAIRAGEYIERVLMTPEGRLYRTAKGETAKLNAYLEDYANVIDAMLELYQLTGAPRWFAHARRLADVVLDQFRADDGGFYDTSRDHEALIVRPRSLQDNATPAGASMFAKQCVRLAAYTGDARYDEAARSTLRLLAQVLGEVPQAFAEALNALDLLVHGVQEVALVGDPNNAATRALLEVYHRTYRPNSILAVAAADVPADFDVPLLSYRIQKGGQPTAYVCRNFVCQLPVSTPADFAQQLAGGGA